MELFIELSSILLITTGISLIIRLLKQPLIVGYIISGILVGPYFLNILQSTQPLELFSKVGIAILLFIVGLSLNPTTIKETGRASVITGIGQIIFTALLGFGIMRLLGFNHTAALYGSVALTFSSTIIILKLLSDRGDIRTLYGKISIGFLLVQDIVATLFLVLIPILGGYLLLQGETSVLYQTLTTLLFKGAIVTVLLYIIARNILPKLSHYLARSQELLFLFTTTWGIVMAGIFYKLGFSIEIGALVAGVTFSASPYAQEISARMKPLRDFFIVLFFILLGSQLILTNGEQIIIPAIILSLFVLIGNPLIVFILMNLMGYRRRTGFMAGLTVAQISEFSLILMALGLSLGHIEETVVSLITLVGIITISGSTYLFLYAEKIYARISPFLSILEWRKIKTIHGNDTKIQPHEIVIFGYGRVGREFVSAAKELGRSYCVIDFDPDAIVCMKKEGVTHIYGDAEDIEFLKEVDLSTTSLIVSTIPQFSINALLLGEYRKQNQHGVSILISHTREETKMLYALGATYVVMPHYLGAYHAATLMKEGFSNKPYFDIEREKQHRQLLRTQE